MNVLSQQALTSECKLHCILSCLPLSAKGVSDCFLTSLVLPEYYGPFPTTNIDVGAHQFLDGTSHHKFLIYDELYKFLIYDELFLVK